MTTATSTIRPLNRSEVAFLRQQLVTDLAHAEKRQGEKGGEWLYWSARVDTLGDMLRALDSLCAAEPWYEPTT